MASPGGQDSVDRTASSAEVADACSRSEWYWRTTLRSGPSRGRMWCWKSATPARAGHAIASGSCQVFPADLLRIRCVEVSDPEGVLSPGSDPLHAPSWRMQPEL